MEAHHCDGFSQFRPLRYILSARYDLCELADNASITLGGEMGDWPLHLDAIGVSKGFAVNSGPPNFTTSFQVLKHDQQKLTSYEFGSKNQFMDNKTEVERRCILL